MSSAGVSARVVARVVAVCAVLVGLFLMHGVSEAEARGCPGGVTSMTSTMVPPTVFDDHVTMAGSVVGSEAAGALPASRHGSEHGALCVSTPARSWLFGLTLVLVAIVVRVLAGAKLPPPQGLRCVHRRRAPPVAGAALLVRVCVSRT